MRLRSRVCLTALGLFLSAGGAYAACQTFTDADGRDAVRSSLTSAGTGMDTSDLPLDGVTVTFSEEGGYGILPGGKLDAFATDFLNLTPETLPKHVAALFRAADFKSHPLDQVKQVPETWSAILGTAMLLILILRRRC
jgi:hypothetical protein